MLLGKTMSSKQTSELLVVGHTFKFSTPEAEAGGGRGRVQGQRDLLNEFQYSQSYTGKPCLIKQNNKTKNSINKRINESNKLAEKLPVPFNR